MDKQPIISVSGISKKFNSSMNKPPRDGIRDLLGSQKKHLQNANSQFKDGSFWALEDISFDVFKGETLGVIGSNGAGKSTLLKVLSQIYQPTEGSFYIDGRVSSLLEVGTGFHQELSGRENIYFNGSLLGMKKAEIEEKFDEIVSFSELEDFIDTPVKYYSSGMRAKLGFSVAVNLDAEVMIIDEALAVGDAKFREKAIKRMKESAFTGKTVLFVTHSMNFVEDACDRVLYLKNGRIEQLGKTKETLEQYLADTSTSTSTKWKPTDTTKVTDTRIVVNAIDLMQNDKNTKNISLGYKDKLEVKLSYKLEEKIGKSYLGYSLFDDQNRRLWRQDKGYKQAGLQTIQLEIDTSILKPGSYYIAADAFIENGAWVVHPKMTDARVGFTITDNRDDIVNEKLEGVIKPPHKK